MMHVVFLYFHCQLAAEGVLSSGSLCVCTKSLWPQYLTNHSWKFHHIYNFGAVGDKDALIRFWGQQSLLDQIWLTITC